MDNRKWESGASATPPDAPVAPSSGYPTDGDPLASIPPTIPGAHWFYQIGEELRAVLVAAGITPDLANVGQLSEAIQRLIDAQSGNYALDTGAANAYVVALSPAITAYTDGMTVRVKAVNASTGASTLDAGAGAVALVNDVGGALVGGDVPAASIFAATYIASANKFYINSLVTSQALTQAVADLRYLQISNARIRLTGALTLYVSTTGNDSNTGLSAGSPFLTVQKAINVLHDGYDLNGYSATIQLADGTYGGTISVSGAFVGAASETSININGNNGTPSNVVLSPVGNCLSAASGAGISISNLKMLPTTGHGILSNNAIVAFNNIVFGAVGAGVYYHIVAFSRAYVYAYGNYSIVGGALGHLTCDTGSLVSITGKTITITGNPTISTYAVNAGASEFVCYGCTFSGTAVGNRYSATTNSVIYTNGGGANYLPGNAAGSTATGGQYV